RKLEVHGVVQRIGWEPDIDKVTVVGVFTARGHGGLDLWCNTAFTYGDRIGNRFPQVEEVDKSSIVAVVGIARDLLAIVVDPRRSYFAVAWAGGNDENVVYNLVTN